MCVCQSVSQSVLVSALALACSSCSEAGRGCESCTCTYYTPDKGMTVRQTSLFVKDQAHVGPWRSLVHLPGQARFTNILSRSDFHKLNQSARPGSNCHPLGLCFRDAMSTRTSAVPDDFPHFAAWCADAQTCVMRAHLFAWLCLSSASWSIGWLMMRWFR